MLKTEKSKSWRKKSKSAYSLGYFNEFWRSPTVDDLLTPSDHSVI